MSTSKSQSEPFRVAMLSGWHVHARGYAQQLRSMDEVEIRAVWDEEDERGRGWAEDLGVDYEEDLDSLLARSDVDGVAVNSPTSIHRDVMVKAARAGKHIFTEKVMALTVAECEDIQAAVEEKEDLIFTISFPHRGAPKNIFAKQVAREGLIGSITLMRVRNAHDGASSGWLPPHFYDEEQTGGGALIDLGAHPMYLARWIMGEPKSVNSSLNSFTDKPVDDNAVAVIEFQSKAMAVVETSFVSHRSPFSLELYGTEGSLFVGGPDDEVQIFSNKLNCDLGGKGGWIKPADLPSGQPKPIRQWVESVVDGAPVRYGLEEGLQLTKLMEAATISDEENRVVEI